MTGTDSVQGMSATPAEHPYCPISRQKCQAGKVWSDLARQDDLVFCAFWHQKEHRCVIRMVEFDLFNIARCLDELRNR
jgi:hypothetical protein